jgi:hypothetical protein
MIANIFFKEMDFTITRIRQLIMRKLIMDIYSMILLITLGFLINWEIKVGK